jgi:pyruvate,water dikinase
MPNYVIISKDYMNLNARMDFHFTMVDSVCGLDLKSNYVKFRFKGGGTSMVRRHRRALALAEILEDADFFIDIKGDLVNAYFGNAPAELIEEKLVVLGRLLGFTRLLDAAMKDDETPHLIAQAFKKGDYQLEELLELWKRQEAEANQ